MSAVLAMEYEQRSPLAGVRALLKDWVQYRKRWAPDNGYPKAVAWLDSIRGAVDAWTEGEDYDVKIHANEMRQVDEAVRLELSPDHQHAIFVVYLNEVGPAVWRSAKKPMSDIRRLCDEAEIRLVPLLRRRAIAL